MKRSLLSVDLRLALKEPGCPICRLRADAELRYIRSLLWEFVNDPLTRSRFIASLGYCREHTWQVGLLEKEKFGSSLGTAILYEHLTLVVSGRLKDYTRRMGWARRPWWKRWLYVFWPWSARRLAARELTPATSCRVCQIGERAEQAHLEWLIRGLAAPEHDFRDAYRASDGLCLYHLRRGLASATREDEDGARVLAESTLQRLATLEQDLREYQRKHSWDYRHEAQTPGEQLAWLRALRFYGGNGQTET